MQHLEHPFPPLYDAQSRVLILGSFPSVKSREVSFFYGHPQNRFWRVLARLLDCPVPQTIDEKSALLHARHIALWDVIASCNITARDYPAAAARGGGRGHQKPLRRGVLPRRAPALQAQEQRAGRARGDPSE